MPTHSRLRRLLALGSLTSVEFLENGMVLFCATQILDGLDLSVRDFALAQTLYGVAAIVMLYQHRWIVERLGYRRFAYLSLTGFGLGSLICALADGAGTFALGRLLQGLGGATFFTAGRLAVPELAPADQGAGMKTFVFSLLGSTALAPLLSALILLAAGWRGIFAFGVAQALVVASLAGSCLSQQTVTAGQRSREHWGWSGAMVAGVFCLQYAVQAPGLSSPDWQLLALALLSGMVTLTLFAWRQYLSEHPLINYRGLLQARYLVGLLLYFCGYFLAGLAGLLIPALLHQGLALAILPTAAITSAGMFVSLAIASLHMRLSQRWPQQRIYMLAGLLLYGIGGTLLATADGMSLSTAITATLMLGMGIPLFLGPVASGTFSELTLQDFSHGYQVKNIVRQLGLSSSIAIGTLGLHALPQLVARSPLPAPLALPSGTAVAACQLVFLAAAALTAPLALLVLRQRIFR